MNLETKNSSPRQSESRHPWLRSESLEDSDNVSDPGMLAQEIVEAFEAALEQFGRSLRI